MKIALIGYGKMGRLVEQIAIEKGHQIVAIISPSSKQKEINAGSIGDADLCIDFSHPHCVVDNIHKTVSLKKNLIVGTTGWYEHLNEIKALVQKYQTGFLYASNFSQGLYLFLKIVSSAAHFIDAFHEYDVGLVELHHQQKADIPSGTAQAIAAALLKGIKRKTKIALEEPVDKEAIHVTSLRCGKIPGTHSVHIDSLSDTITLTHEARNREGFARGAVAGAEWLLNKKGFFTLDEMYA